ncbi:homoserine O-succinyltransferase MetA [Methylobacterium sp. A54F]
MFDLRRDAPAEAVSYGGLPASLVEGAGAAPLRIGLLNNMPDAALAATERQFRNLLQPPGGPAVELLLFSLDGLERGALGAEMASRYLSHRFLASANLDALIVTGCEPRPGPLQAEPWFPAFGEVVDWARGATASTLFSCLAAHGAVLHLSGLARTRLPVKRWGVFACAAAGTHPLLAGAPAIVPVPHSRWNDLPAAELAAAGYRVLRASAQAGADLFVREEGSLLVFLQGHPEYDRDSLAREHRRDVGRYCAGERPDYPPLPENYFGPQAAAALDAFSGRARARPDARTFAGFPSLDPAPPLAAAWQAEAHRLMGAWLAEVARRRATASRVPIPSPCFA